MPTPADFTSNELWIVNSAVRERYGREVQVLLADTEVTLEPSQREPLACPAVFWRERGSNFVVFKTGERRYRCQFFDRELAMYGTGRVEYDDLAECVVCLLQAEADHARERALADAAAQERRR